MLIKKAIRAADAKEVGVGNPAEETYRYPNQTLIILEIIPKLSTSKMHQFMSKIKRGARPQKQS